MKFANPNTQDKKIYCRPEFTAIEIDKEISLVMMSANPNNDPQEGTGPGNDKKEDDPFGSSFEQ